jgi:hypothetical protein
MPFNRNTWGVWAVGDCAGSPHFTHISEDDFASIRPPDVPETTITATRTKRGLSIRSRVIVEQLPSMRLENEK